ncbi:MAG: FAD-dependent monooxygenase, partial [Myxococcales bacterium]|nr:FAD-dependent monooxygenase [Myxococcales bacterium]
MGEAMRASVIIVGAGPVGLTLANLLGREGVETLVLERNPETTDEPRAIAADDETLRTMQGLGLLEVWERDLFRDMPGRLRSTSGELLAEIRPAPTGNGYAIFNTFHQPIFERTLLGGAERYPSVSVRFGHEVTGLEQNGNGVTVRGVRPGGDAFEARGAWLVGCDGGRSFVRKHLGIGFVGSTYSERWLVLDTEGDTWNQRDGSFIMDPARPTVTIYRTKGRRRWEFLQMPGETDAFLLDDATIHRLLAPHIDPDAVTVHRKVVYLFHARIAERYGEGRILLAGDAAHVMPPFVGQGMNSGIRDAVNLGWKLAACVRHGASPEILATYEPERREHQRKVTNLSVWVGRLFMQRRRSLAAARNGILRLLRAIP